MSSVVNEFPQSRKSKYPWDLWLDGQIHQLTKGEDFDREPYRFARNFYTCANRYGYSARVVVRGDQVFVQATRAEKRGRVNAPLAGARDAAE